MSDTTTLMRRYLLAELSEREQADLEARYFEDPRLFDELVETESALVDDYVRGRLTPETRQRFETSFMADPRRRERVRFAEALATAIDRPALSEPDERGAAQAEAGNATTVASWLAWLRTPRFATAAAAIVALVAVGIWLVSNSWRAEEQAARSAPDRRAGEQASSTRPPSGETRPSGAPPPEPSRVPPSVVTVATITLVVGPGERSAVTGEPPILTIPRDAEQVRFTLALREHDYARYRVRIRAIGGAEVVRQGDLAAVTNGTQPSLIITAGAGRFESGDYMLTLQGAPAAGEYEDLSQTIFQVARQP